jgi:threonine synthase
VSDDEIVAGIRLLAETEGIFAETAGGVTVANLKRFASPAVGATSASSPSSPATATRPSRPWSRHVGPTFEVSPALDDFLAQLDLAR